MIAYAGRECRECMTCVFENMYVYMNRKDMKNPSYI